MQVIDKWVERHPVSSKILAWFVGMFAIYGGYWAIGAWIDHESNPNTVEAHLYCSFVAVGPDGKFDPVKANEEVAKAKHLAYAQGGTEAVKLSYQTYVKIGEEFQTHVDKGDIDDLMRHYQDACKGR